MFQLKPYQNESLDLLRRYLESARFSGAQAAFDKIQIGSASYRAYQPLAGLENVPYVCMRLPTGGGKTVLAAYSIGVATNAYLEQDYAMVLWLVPTNAIRTQTLDTLKNPDHSNRRALYETFGDRFLVIDIADFEQLRPQDVRGKTCVVVGTMATLRVNSTEGRRVYAHNENLETHFANVPDNTEGMERIEEGTDAGKIKFSFRNLVALCRPLVILDEAHNDTSPLSVKFYSASTRRASSNLPRRPHRTATFCIT